MAISTQPFLGCVFLPVNCVNMLRLYMLVKFRLDYTPVISTPHFPHTKYSKLPNPTPKIQRQESIPDHIPTSPGVHKSAWRHGCWGHYGAEIFIRQILWCGLKTWADSLPRSHVGLGVQVLLEQAIGYFHLHGKRTLDR